MAAAQIYIIKKKISELFRLHPKPIKEVCSEVGISHQTFRNIETLGAASMNTIFKIADYFNVNYTELINDPDRVKYQKSLDDNGLSIVTEPEATPTTLEGKMIMNTISTYVSSLENKLAELEAELKKERTKKK